MKSASKNGQIVTFYSFKGGVGRSMALANLAVLLAQSGKKVLAVDWDLEAPGLQSYFASLKHDQPKKAGGLLWFLKSDSHSKPSNWRDFVFSYSVPGDTSVDFLSSGFEQDDYSHELGLFSWRQYFAKRSGANRLERLRNDWIWEYDFVLLDSRTGLTDASGVCTIQMPDLLVLLFAANAQNVEGCRQVAEAARAGRREIAYDRSHMFVLPVLSRFDAQEESKTAKRWMRKVAETFTPFYEEWLPTDIKPYQIVNWLRLPYLPILSFGEQLTVLDKRSISDTQGISFYYNILAQILLSRFRRLRTTLAAVGVTDAILKPLLPEGDILRTQLRDDPKFAKRLMNKISEFADENIEQVLRALDQLAAYAADFQVNTADEILETAVELAQIYDEDRPEEVMRLQLRHADMLAKAGREDEALAKYHQARKFVRDTFGKNSSQSAFVLEALATFRATAKDKLNLKIAEAEYRLCLKYATANFSENDPRLAKYSVSFAEFLARIGREHNNQSQKTEALNQLSHAINIYRISDSISGNNYAANLNSTIERRYELRMELALYSEALDDANELLVRAERRRTQDKRAFCDALERLGWARERVGHYDEAEDCYRKSLRLKKTSWPDSVQYAGACAKLADVLTQRGLYQEAEGLVRDALKIQEDQLGKDDPEVANTLSILAETLEVAIIDGENRFIEAAKYLRRALRIRLEAFGLEDHVVATTYTQFGSLYYHAKLYKEADKSLQSALLIDRRSYEESHPEVAFDLLTLASVLARLSQSAKVADGEREKLAAKATEYWQRNLPIYEDRLGRGYEQAARQRVLFAEHLANLGKLDEARQEIEMAIDGLTRALGKEHPFVRKIAMPILHQLEDKKVNS